MEEIGRRKQVRLGGFTRASLEDEAGRRGVGVGLLVHQAIVYYAADRESGRQGWRLPRFASGANSRAEAFDLELSEHDWETLTEEARFQGVDEERLLDHMVLYYLADLEAGKVALRILRSIEDPPEETE
jgi:hypothetical protein